MTLKEWMLKSEDENYKIVKQTSSDNGRFVSTVWLGLDHQYGTGPPLIFETRVFPRRGDYEDLDCERYPTLAEAKRGHEAMLEKWRQRGGAPERPA